MHITVQCTSVLFKIYPQTKVACFFIFKNFAFSYVGINLQHTCRCMLLIKYFQWLIVKFIVLHLESEFASDVH